MIIVSKICFCCYKDDQIKSEPPVEEITPQKLPKTNGNKSKDIFQGNKTNSNNKETTENISNKNVENNITQNTNLSNDDIKNDKNNDSMMKDSETAAITNMMLDDINDDDLEITPIIHSESEIKVDLNAIEEASLDDIYELKSKEKDNNNKTNNNDETSSRVMKMLKDDSKLDITPQSIDSGEVDDDDDDEEGIEVEIKETIPEIKASGIITQEDSLVGNTNIIQKSAMYGDNDDESDSEDSEDSSDSDDSSDETTDDDSETTDDAKENITTTTLSKVEEKKNITVKRDGSTITAIPAIIHSEHTDDEMSEKVI